MYSSHVAQSGQHRGGKCVTSDNTEQIQPSYTLVLLTSDRVQLFHTCSVLSGYGRDCLDNELDMELDDEEEMDGFTEDRLD